LHKPDLNGIDQSEDKFDRCVFQNDLGYVSSTVNQPLYGFD